MSKKKKSPPDVPLELEPEQEAQLLIDTFPLAAEPDPAELEHPQPEVWTDYDPDR